MNSEKSMCILDLDGTLDLTDPRLSVELINLSKNGMDFVPATGRTNNYVKQTCRQNNIIPPRYIIADNGGTIFDNREGRYLRKTKLNRDARKRILEEYIRERWKIRRDKIYRWG